MSCNIFFLLAVAENNLKQCNFIHEALNNSEIKAYLLFLKFSLQYFNSLNALFQGRDILIHKLGEESRRIFRKLALNFIKTEEFRNNVDCKNPRNFKELNNVYLGHQCESFIENLHFEITTNEKKCLQFYITACDEIQHRLPLEDIFFKPTLLY